MTINEMIPAFEAILFAEVSRSKLKSFVPFLK